MGAQWKKWKGEFHGDASRLLIRAIGPVSEWLGLKDMNELVQWFEKYPPILEAQYRKGVITLNEFVLATQFHKSLKAQFDLFQVALYDIDADKRGEQV